MRYGWVSSLLIRSRHIQLCFISTAQMHFLRIFIGKYFWLAWGTSYSHYKQYLSFVLLHGICLVLQQLIFTLASLNGFLLWYYFLAKSNNSIYILTYVTVKRQDKLKHVQFYRLWYIYHPDCSSCVPWRGIQQGQIRIIFSCVSCVSWSLYWIDYGPPTTPVGV